MKKIVLVLMAVMAMMLGGCDDAKIASENLSKAADNFEIDRRVVFYNGITGEYMLTMEGKCAIVDRNRQLEVTCKVGNDQYKKHFLGLSDNVTYFAEQMTSVGVSVYHHRIIFKPQAIIPDIDFKGSITDIPKNK